MRIRLSQVLAVMTFMTAAVYAQSDVPGKWSGELPAAAGRGPAQPITVELKIDGDSLTGSVTEGALGARPITNAAVEGSTFSFRTTQNFGSQDIVVSWFGEIKGDALSLMRNVGAVAEAGAGGGGRGGGGGGGGRGGGGARGAAPPAADGAAQPAAAGRGGGAPPAAGGAPQAGAGRGGRGGGAPAQGAAPPAAGGQQPPAAAGAAGGGRGGGGGGGRGGAGGGALGAGAAPAARPAVVRLTTGTTLSLKRVL